MSFNKIIVAGNLGRDPELRYSQQGTPVCSFSIASNERRKDKSGEVQDITTWFRVTLWGKQAETAAQYLTKGRPVYIEGRLRMEEYTDKQGTARTSLEIHATDMQFIGGNGNGNGNGEREAQAPIGATAKANVGASNGRATATAPAAAGVPEDDDLGDDIPF